jgi:hypothetical protein
VVRVVVVAVVVVGDGEGEEFTERSERSEEEITRRGQEEKVQTPPSKDPKKPKLFVSSPLRVNLSRPSDLLIFL